MGVVTAVVGASGYAGGELLRLLLAHPEFEVGPLLAGASAGTPVTDLHPHLRALSDRVFEPTTVSALEAVDVVFFALPHGESGALSEALPTGTRIVDLGADHRLRDPAEWDRVYGGPYAQPWTYGLPELPGQRAEIAGSTRVANTGCYAVAITLALAPLIATGLVHAEDVVVVAASGTTGAGRSAKAHLLASEIMGDLSPYRVGAHQHVPEIKQATGCRSLAFTPVLAPMPRGILATITARPHGAVTVAAARSALAAAYAGERFVHLLPEGRWPHTSATIGSNACHLQVTVDRDSGRVVVVSALDNLGKGAAGQAVQNANLMLGWDESLGLTGSGVAP